MFTVNCVLITSRIARREMVIRQIYLWHSGGLVRHNSVPEEKDQKEKVKTAQEGSVYLYYFRIIHQGQIVECVELEEKIKISVPIN